MVWLKETVFLNAARLEEAGLLNAAPILKPGFFSQFVVEFFFAAVQFCGNIHDDFYEMVAFAAAPKFCDSVFFKLEDFVALGAGWDF